MGKGRSCLDLIGQKFNRLTVLKRDEDYIDPRGKHESKWICVCDCGNTKSVRGSMLKNGTVKSCGCLRKENMSNIAKSNQKYNTYDLSGEYGIGYTLKGEEFYFDLEDYDLIKDYCWSINDQGYVRASLSKSNNKRTAILFHKAILPDAEEVDHIRGHLSRNDNRKANLRAVNHSQNMMNRKIYYTNTSGATGVDWSKHANKWRASIYVNKKYIHIGYFEKFEDAVKARKEAEEKYFGEYSYDNSQKKEVV